MLWRSSIVTQIAAVPTNIQRTTGGAPAIDGSSQLRSHICPSCPVGPYRKHTPRAPLRHNCASERPAGLCLHLPAYGDEGLHDRTEVAMEVRVGPPTVTVHADDEFVVCEQSAEMSSTEEQGYFAADTRLVSGYRLKLGRVRPVLFNSSAIASHSARFEFTNAQVLDADGGVVNEHCLHLRLDRVVGHGVHEDYELTNYSRRRVEVSLEISIESDFADLFDVKNHRTVRRGSVQSTWDEHLGRLVTRYSNETFRRGLTLEVKDAGSKAEYANGGIMFRIAVDPGQSWHTCLLWRPNLDESGPEHPPVPCHNLLGETERDALHHAWV